MDAIHFRTRIYPRQTECAYPIVALPCLEPTGVAPAQLCIVNVTLEAAEQELAIEEIQAGSSFLESSVTSNVPANTFVVVDTHSNMQTGHLQYGGERTITQCALASEVLSEYCGQTFLGEMCDAASVARMAEPSTKSDEFNTSPSFRGGWRALVLTTCGAAIRIKHSFDDLFSLVQR